MPSESLIHADIFFFISTIALTIINIGIIIVLIYIIRILKTAHDITEKIKIESTEILEDIKKLRLTLRNEGAKWKQIADLFRNFFDLEKLEVFAHRILERWFGNKKIVKPVKVKKNKK